jgi:hypothetical protein
MSVVDSTMSNIYSNTGETGTHRDTVRTKMGITIDNQHPMMKLESPIQFIYGGSLELKAFYYTN